jgi:OPA family glycerol-3-phosphate transporter-like MFS transporter
MIFPLTGAGASLLGGWLLDRTGGRAGRIMLPSLLLLVGTLAVLGVVPLVGRSFLALLFLATVSIFLMIPYTFCSGVLAINLGGKQAGATACGLIDFFGYLGAVFSGYGIARVAGQFGWSAAFAVLAGAALLTCGAVVLFMLLPNNFPLESDRD